MTREELWLAAIAGLDGVNPPDYPVWHYEEMLAAIYDAVVGADSPRQFPERSWHLDEFLYAVYCVAAGLDDPGCPEPTDRIELFWKGVYDGVKGEAGASVPTPVWRIEEFLSAVFTASAGWGERTLTGSIVSFIGRSSSEITALTAAITPVQSGSGDPSPSNVRPITGWTGAKVTRTGKNLLQNIRDDSVTLNTLVITKNADGSITLNGTPTANTFYNIDFITSQSSAVLDLTPFRGKTLCLSISDTAISGITSSLSWFAGSSTPNIISGVTTSGHGVVPNDAGKSRTFIRIESGTVCNNVTLYPQLELGSTATAYEPYQGTTYPVTWQTEAGTVYGGTLDVVTGVLRVRPEYASYNGETLVGPWLSSMDVYAAGTTPTTGAQVVDLGGTETSYQLTPQTVTALLGQNYVWADTGDVTVTVKGAGVA